MSGIRRFGANRKSINTKIRMMQSKFTIQTVFSTLLALALVVTLGACKKDTDPNEATNNALQGDWEVNSWTVDGTEQMNFSVASFDMEFTKQGPADGETEWTIIDTGGGTTRIEGDYDIENSGTEIDIDGDEFDVEIDGDELELRGNFNAELWIIQAERD